MSLGLYIFLGKTYSFLSFHSIFSIISLFFYFLLFLCFFFLFLNTHNHFYTFNLLLTQKHCSGIRVLFTSEPYALIYFSEQRHLVSEREEDRLLGLLYFSSLIIIFFNSVLMYLFSDVFREASKSTKQHNINKSPLTCYTPEKE